MPNSPKLEKAQLVELDADMKVKSGGKKVMVQFNPETLKVSYQNQIQTPSGTGDQKGTQARQFVGAGTTKLSLQLWFDVNAPLPESKAGTIDVRELTKDVAFFITPAPTNDNPPQYIPPGVRFLWGSFHFDGLMDSLEESLEFFSNEGVPLRASMSLNLSQQKIEKFEGRQGGGAVPPGAGGLSGAAVGTAPLAQAPAGSTLQGMVDSAGAGGSWQAIAAANGIENPRLLSAGQLIDLNASASSSAAASSITVPAKLP